MSEIKKREDGEGSISEDLSRRYKKGSRSFTLWLLGTKTGIMTLIGVIAFVVVWILAGLWWAIGAIVLCIVIPIVLKFVKKRRRKTTND